MERDIDLTQKVRKYCKKIGVDVVGFADPKYFDRFPKTNQPESYLKDSLTVIILGKHLYDIMLDSYFQPPKARKYFHFADSILETFCYKVKDFLNEKGYSSKVISYNPGFYLKDISALAGIGPIGKNNLLITENFGSQVRLRALTTTAPLECGTPITKSKYCENCDLCIKACPAQAFSEGKYNKEKCLNYNFSNLTKLSESISIWCNVCIESCPVGKASK